MFAVFQFFHLIQYEIFQTTASMGPFMLPHAVCAVIVIIFVSSILAPDNTLKSDDQILHVDDPPNQLGLRTPSSTETKPRQQQRTPKNTYKTHSYPTFPTIIRSDQPAQALSFLQQYKNSKHCSTPFHMFPTP